MEFHEVLVVIILIALICLVLYSYRNCRHRNNLKEYYQRPITQHLRIIGRRENRKVKK